MRVLHIGKYYPPYAGGMENFLGDLLPALQRVGWRVAALVHGQGCEVATGEEEQSGIDLLRRVPSYGQLLYAPLSPDFGRQLERIVAEFQPDLLHFHLPNVSAFWGLLSARCKQIPWLVHWHADVVPSRLDPRLAVAYWLYRPWEQALLARAAAILVTSPPYLATSRPLAPWRAKCQVVPLGLDPGRMTAIADGAAEEWSGGSWFRLLAVGRLAYYKGHEVLIEAAARLPGVEVVIVGGGGRAAKLQKLITSLGAGDRIKLAGTLPDAKLHALLASADALCLPSLERTEAFGLVLLEAMWYAKPVLATTVAGAGMSWVVEDGRTGFLTPPGDVAALAAAISRLATERAAAVACGRAGRQKVSQHFQIQTVATGITAIYRRLLVPG